MSNRFFVWIGFGIALISLPFGLLAKSGTFGVDPPTFHPLAPPATFTVTTNGDTGVGSLRAAIDQANTTPGTDIIDFSSGLGTISVGSVTGMPLPTITEGVTIDPGSSKVELDGSAAGAAANGLTIMANGVTVRNLVINRFSGDGINIQGDGNVIQGNLIGTNAAGTTALPNAGNGVSVNGANNVIGGNIAAARNVISGNGTRGVSLGTNTTHNNALVGNFIGTDASGTSPVPNQNSGVGILGGAFNNLVGGTAAGSANSIAFNAGAGVFIPAGSGNSVLSNSIFNNELLGIDLSDDDGVTPNDACDVDPGANGLQNFPVLTSATSSGVGTTILGSLNSTAGGTFRIEFFASPSCDFSGNGPGRMFLGATNVTANGACVADINVNFGIVAPVGQVVTATATDASGDTSEFSACVVVTAAPSCMIICPASIAVATGPNSTSCGVPVDYQSPAVIGACGTVNCAPPAGSIFAVGTTSVTCSGSGGANCSFDITIIDNTAPRLICSTGVTKPAPPGTTSAVVTYPSPTASDNCGSVDVKCSPASGSTFPIGTTLVTCSALDLSLNTTNCFFNITVVDADPPVITCPPDINAAPLAGQTSAVVTYPPPTVVDNLPGATFACSPASGSTFPLGVTPVTCTATDAMNNKASCSFNVSVGGAVARVTIPGGKAAVEFGNPTPVDTRRKPQKLKNNQCSLLTIENIGFAPLILTLDSIARAGADVDSGKIADPNDSRYFVLSLVNADQSQTTLDPGAVVTIQPQKAQIFCLRFNALLPPLAGKTNGIAASQDLPDTMNSRVVFRQNAGAPLSVQVLCHVGTALTLIDPTNPRRPPLLTFTRDGNNFHVSFAVHDSNLDLDRARYEFLDDTGRVVDGAFEIDLAGPVRSLNLVKGQSVAFDQAFTGANSHPEVAGVRVTVFDRESSAIAEASRNAAAASTQLPNGNEGVTVYLPSAKLGSPTR